MYYIPAGLLAKHGEAYYNAAIMAGMTPDQLDSMTVGSGSAFVTTTIDLVHRIIAGIHRVMHLTIPVNMRTEPFPCTPAAA